jgi:hypothetical protein
MIEKVIKWVNEQKALAGSTEPNVVLGISMGGLVAKYALLDMVNTSTDHDTRLLITYDAPLRGANIPLGTQAAVQFAAQSLFVASAFGVSPIPAVNQGFFAITSPAPRQILKYSISHTNGTAEPTNPEHIAFMAELDAMGSLPMRHTAISNGDAAGTFIQNNIAAGATMFNLISNVNFCTTINIPLIGPAVVCDGGFHADFTVNATGNNTITQLFDTNVDLDVDFPVFHVHLNKNLTCFTKPYDVAPGGSSLLGTFPLGLIATFLPAGVPIAGTGLTSTHHCFIPTFSSMSAPEPSNLMLPQTCGTANRCSAPTMPVLCPFSGLPEINEQHVGLDNRIALLLVDELVTTQANPFGVLSSTLNSYYNVGDPSHVGISSVKIFSSNGKLSINNEGLVSFATGNEIIAPLNLLKAYTKCASEIVVEQGAKLVVGSDNKIKHGQLSITPGSLVHIKAGGILYVTSSESALIIKSGANLILDPGAIVILDHPESKIRIEGTLTINGDIIFQGGGYFEFVPGHNLDVAGDFKLEGSNTRFVKITEGAEVALSGAHRLLWSKGKIEYERNTAVRLTDGAGGIFDQINFVGLGTLVTATGIFAQGSGHVFIRNSNASGLKTAFDLVSFNCPLPIEYRGECIIF